MQRTVIDERYTLLEPLGDGGMARVYLAHDEVLDRDVAIKVLRDAYADDEEFVERFRREARSAAGLTHPNIVSVFDQGRSEDGAYYIAMEYVPRGTLNDRIKRSGHLASNAAAGVAQQIADALSAAHEKGVIHRDIKPQNVLVTASGDVKVTDFGIARAASLNKLTATSAVMGTAAYMSPEQALGRPVGPESDLYSLGAVLYEMLTGSLPYTSDDAHPVALAMKHVNEPVPSPREVNPDVPEALDAITSRLLAKKPEDRYASAAALADDLERFLSGNYSPPAAPTAKMEKETEKMTAPLPPAPPRERTQRTAVQPPVRGLAARGKRRGGRLLPALGALLLGLLLLGGLALGLRENGSEETSQPQVPEDTSGADVANQTPEPSSQAVQSLPPANAAVPEGAAVDDIPTEGASAGAVPAPPTPVAPPPAAPSPGAATGNSGSGGVLAPPNPEEDLQEQQEDLQEQQEEQQEDLQEKQEERREEKKERQGKKGKGKDE